MRQNFGNSGGGANVLMSRLAAEKKKAIIAVSLIVLMVFMWVRVFKKKSPQSAGAVVVTHHVSGSQSKPELKISFIELPKVEGRNDVLTRDFFDAEGWRGFVGDGGRSGVGEVSVVSGGGKTTVKRIAERITLEAIGLGANPWAFVNDRVLCIGDKLPVSDGDKTYECEVTGIEENVVFLRCGEAEIELKLTQTKPNGSVVR